MKKILFLFLVLFVGQSAVLADNDKSVQLSEMPQKAQQFIKSYFSGNKVALSKMDTDFFDKSYEVIFTNGDKVEFDKKGNWRDVDCKYSHVPTPIVPIKILNYVKSNYVDQKILKIDVDKRGYEIKLSNGIELEFDLKYRVINID